MADIYFKKTRTIQGDYWQLMRVANVLPEERSGLGLALQEYQVMSGDIGEPEQAAKGMAKLRAELEADGHRLHFQDVSESRQIIENIDSYEGGVPRRVDPFKDQIDRLLKGPDYEPELRYDYHPTDPKFKEQWPEPEPKWHPGHRSSRMSMNRNTRRKGFGYTDVYSLRDRGWPYANRGFDRRRKAWERAVARFGQVRGAGEGI